MEKMIRKKKDVRSHDDFYLKDKKYQNNPKYTTKVIYRMLKRKNFKSLIDIGCGNGDFLKYISKRFVGKKYIGTDIHKSLIKQNKKKHKNIKFYYDNINLAKSQLKADIVHATGVINIFDKVEKFLKNIILRCNSKGQIFIIHYFNDYDLDYLVRYRNNKFSKTNLIEEQGWNVFSKSTISRILNQNKKVKKFRFIEIKFPKNINVKKNKQDLCISWSVNFKNCKYFINGLGFLNKIYLLKIELK